MKISERVLLPQVLQEVHQTAVVSMLNQYSNITDMKVSQWDTGIVADAINKLESYFMRKTVSELLYSLVYFDGQPYQYKKTHSVNIGSFDSVQLLDASTSYYETLLFEKEKKATHKMTPGAFAVAEITGPVREMSIRLGAGSCFAKSAKRPYKDELKVFMSQDMPPVAVHLDDLEYVSDKHGMCNYDLPIIEKVEQDFGPEALIFLNDDACRGLIRAIRKSKAEVAQF